MSDFDALLDTPIEDIKRPDHNAAHKAEILAAYVPVAHNIKLPAQQSASFQFLSLEDLEALADPKWLIDKMLIEGSFNVFFGAPGIGKSFVAISMALAIAYGIPCFGADTLQGDVVYIAAEGLLGFKSRVPAFTKNYGVTGEPPIFFVSGNIDLNDDNLPYLMNSFIKDAGIVPRLIIVDTLARTFGSGDENTAKDMNKYIAGIDILRKNTRAAVLVLHHTTKNDKRTERGSSALRGAADTIISCEGTAIGKGSGYILHKIWKTRRIKFLANLDARG